MDWLIFLYVLCLAPIVLCSHHWIVTETGRIEPKLDSAYPVRRPYDFFSLLEQEERVAQAAEVQRMLAAIERTVQEESSNIEVETDFEKRVYATDPNCQYSGSPLSQHPTTPKFIDFPSKKIRGVGNVAPPNCKEYSKLDFSLLTFPHLKTLRDHENVSVELSEISSDAPRDIDLRAMLERNNSDWTAYNLAVYYWQLKRNHSQAIECARRAIYFAPSEYRYLALFNLGTLLQAMKSFGEAAIVLHTCVDLDWGRHQSHMALGHVYVHLGDTVRAAGCYENALSLRPDLVDVAKLRAAVLCHQTIINGLLATDAALKKITGELKEYSKLQERWVLTYSQIGLEKACSSPMVSPPDNLRALWKDLERQALLVSQMMTRVKSAANAAVELEGDRPDTISEDKKKPLEQSLEKEITLKRPEKQLSGDPKPYRKSGISFEAKGNFKENEPEGSPYWQILYRCLSMGKRSLLPEECGQHIFAEFVAVSDHIFPGAKYAMYASAIENHDVTDHDEF